MKETPTIDNSAAQAQHTENAQITDRNLQLWKELEEDIKSKLYKKRRLDKRFLRLKRVHNMTTVDPYSSRDITSLETRIHEMVAIETRVQPLLEILNDKVAILDVEWSSLKGIFLTAEESAAIAAASTSPSPSTDNNQI